jgi:hypothetical protein
LDKVIQDIVAIDLECSQIVEKARQKKQDVQAHMNEKKKEIYDSFVKEYQVKIDAHKKELEEQIQATKERNEEDYKKSLAHLSDLYNEKENEWVDTIVKRCKEV